MFSNLCFCFTSSGGFLSLILLRCSCFPFFVLLRDFFLWIFFCLIFQWILFRHEFLLLSPFIYVIPSFLFRSISLVLPSFLFHPSSTPFLPFLPTYFTFSFASSTVYSFSSPFPLFPAFFHVPISPFHIFKKNPNLTSPRHRRTTKAEDTRIQQRTRRE